VPGGGRSAAALEYRPVLPLSRTLPQNLFGRFNFWRGPSLKILAVSQSIVFPLGLVFAHSINRRGGHPLGTLFDRLGVD
jgi:hypothetical protein